MQILFLGPQGAGKGTQAKKLSEKIDLPHLSSGDLLRQAVADGTPAGTRAKEYMDAGKLVPDDVLIAMFEEKLTGPECRGGFILDGFPRNLAQAKALDGLLVRLNVPLMGAVNLKINDALAMERMTGRRNCPNCGAIYHIKFTPPKQTDVCDNCAAKLMQRSDDTEAACRKRLEVYHEQTEPLIGYYDGNKILVSVDASAEPQTVFLKIMQTLGLN